MAKDAAGGAKRNKARAKPRGGKRGPGGKRKAAPKKKALDPSTLSVTQVAELLQLPRETIKAHLAAGAPSAGGRRPLNLIAYTAWLAASVVARRRLPRGG